MSENALSTLRERVRGAVITLDDEEYERVRRVHNGMIDRRPRAVVQCADVTDVRAVVDAAREGGLAVAIRGGGHSVPGFGTGDDALVADLSAMKAVRVDPQQRTARVEGGCTWGDLDHATHGFGLVTTGGVISTTGVGGLTLGGGIGHLARGCGLSCDNLLSADVVTANGEFVTASEAEHPDLFWALRGGGGNFGVVTSLEFRLHPRDTIYGGPSFHPLDRAAQVLASYHDYIAKAPEELGAFFMFQIAPPLPFIPQERHDETMCGIVTCWSGPLEDGEPALAPLLADAGPVVAQHVGPAPYPVLNSAFDGLYPDGLHHYWKADFVGDLTDAAIEAHLHHGPRVPSVHSTVHLYAIDGAVHRVPATRPPSRTATPDTRRSSSARGPTRPTTRRTPPGFAATGKRSTPTPRKAATSTSWPPMTRTASEPTTPATTTGWPRSRGPTTPPTSSTSTKTSRRLLPEAWSTGPDWARWPSRVATAMGR